MLKALQNDSIIYQPSEREPIKEIYIKKDSFVFPVYKPIEGERELLAVLILPEVSAKWEEAVDSWFIQRPGAEAIAFMYENLVGLDPALPPDETSVETELDRLLAKAFKRRPEEN